MTVKRLIEILEKQNQDLKVVADERQMIFLLNERESCECTIILDK